MEASWLRIGVFDLTSAQEHPMTDAPVSPLRRRMIEDMTIRKFAPRTQEGYIRAVKGFSAFFGASPDRASFEDLRRYQLHLVASGAGSRRSRRGGSEKGTYGSSATWTCATWVRLSS